MSSVRAGKGVNVLAMVVRCDAEWEQKRRTDYQSDESVFDEEKPMCEICEKVKTIDFFPTPKVYLDCLKYIQSLVDSGSFQFESKDCDTDKVKDENGHWIDDVISHVIKCKNCGQCFTCTAVTYRGSGNFRKGK